VLQVLTAVSLDREQTSSYHLVITCSDRHVSNVSLTGRAALCVVVDDVNDHAPAFFRSRRDLLPLTASVTENQPSGTPVTVVTAADPDDGRNAEVSYRLASSSSDDFRLDATSGLLTTRRQFDRETQQTVNVTVVAADAGVPALSSTIDITVSILDQDDEVSERDQRRTKVCRYNCLVHCAGPGADLGGDQGGYIFYAGGSIAGVSCRRRWPRLLLLP